jgi:hypothetical protein
MAKLSSNQRSRRSSYSISGRYFRYRDRNFEIGNVRRALSPAARACTGRSDGCSCRSPREISSQIDPVTSASPRGAAGERDGGIAERRASPSRPVPPLRRAVGVARHRPTRRGYFAGQPVPDIRAVRARRLAAVAGSGRAGSTVIAANPPPRGDPGGDIAERIFGDRLTARRHITNPRRAQRRPGILRARRATGLVPASSRRGERSVAHMKSPGQQVRCR